MFIGISVWQLLIILLIVVALFGSKRIRSLGSDLGSMLKGFRASVKDENDGASDSKESKNSATERTKSG